MDQGLSPDIMRELKFMQLFDHRNVVHLYESFVENCKVYLVMPFYNELSSIY